MASGRTARRDASITETQTRSVTLVASTLTLADGTHSGAAPARTGPLETHRVKELARVSCVVPCAVPPEQLFLWIMAANVLSTGFPQFLRS